MTALYICYQAITEPLTRTQVVPYLEGLAAAGHQVILLTYEMDALAIGREREIREELRRKGIDWLHLRYHKRPSAPATLLDVLQGLRVVVGVSRRRDVALLHCRAHVPVLIALLARRLTGARILFDLRGFMAEEYADAGVWRLGGMLYRLAKRVERLAVSGADAVVVLTDAAKAQLGGDYGERCDPARVTVIPCCVDLRGQRQLAEAAAPRSAGGPLRLGYVGKLRGRYWTEAMAAFVAGMARRRPDVQWHVWTQDDPAALLTRARALGMAERVRVGRVAPEAIQGCLQGIDAALAFYRPGAGNVGTSPTKVAEYLAAGVPVVANRGVGDLDRLLADRRVGVVVDPAEWRDGAGAACAADELLRLLADPALPARCAATARELLDLETVGWPRYRDIYRRLERSA